MILSSPLVLWDTVTTTSSKICARSQELAKTADEILREPKPKEEPKEIHLDEKDEKEAWTSWTAWFFGCG
jgi:hypothetical protein